MKRKIMILTVTAGEGHNSISKALRNKLSENPENQVKVVDLFKKYGGTAKASFINDGYIASCKYAMPIYNTIFKILQNQKPDNRNNSLSQGTVMPETPKLLQDIYLYEPDIILCTHFYPAIIITNLRKVYPIPSKVISILPDYTVHPFWECAIGVDYLVTPISNFHEELKYKGYKEEQLKDFGIPVREEFSILMDKAEARKTLNLEPNLFTVMVMLGGGGFGGTDKILRKLLKVKEPIQILMVNGKDKAGKKRVDTILKQVKTNHVVHNYGFIDFVQTAMASADVIVGKCGGITVNESLNKVKPLILNNKLAQQEADNMLFLKENGTALVMDNKNKLENIITDLMHNPEKLKGLEANIMKIRKPNALRDICAFAESLEKTPVDSLPDINMGDYQKVRLEIKKQMRLENKAHAKKKREDRVLKLKEKKLSNALKSPEKIKKVKEISESEKVLKEKQQEIKNKRKEIQNINKEILEQRKIVRKEKLENKKIKKSEK